MRVWGEEATTGLEDAAAPTIQDTSRLRSMLALTNENHYHSQHGQMNLCL